MDALTDFRNDSENRIQCPNLQDRGTEPMTVPGRALAKAVAPY